MSGSSETYIGALARELSHLQRRAARQKRNIGSSEEAWQRWSTTMDQIANPAQRVIAFPAPDLESLRVKFKALLWLIEANESLLDHSDLHRLRRFGRELAVLAEGASQA